MRKPPRRILIVRTDRMGDLLMCLPAISALRRAFPQAELTLLLKEELKPLLEGHPDLDRLLTLREPAGRGGWAAWRLGKRLRAFRFDAAVLFNPTRLFHQACFLARIPIRVGYRRKWGFLLTRSIPDTKHRRDLHETEYNQELVRLLGASPSTAGPVLPERPGARAEALRLLESRGLHPGVHPLIALHPWTSNLSKGWGLENFWETARRLRTEGMPVVLIGEPAGPESPRGLPAGVVNLCGQIPLRVLPECLRLCSVLLTNDSGPAHVAAAVGTPVTVAAPAEHAKQLQRWRPAGASHRILLSPGVEEALSAVREQARLRAGR